MIRYRIPLRGLKFSTNKIYAGIHWSERKQIKDSILSVAAGFCRPVQDFGPYPVSISYRFFFASRPLDTLNTAAMAKMFEDAFRALGHLKDDDPRYVTRTILEVVIIPREKKKAVADARSSQADSKDKDWLEVSVEKYSPTYIK